MGNIETFLAQNLKRWRKKSGLSQAELAKKSGLTIRTVNRYENARQPARAANVAAIAAVLGCSVPDLYREPGATLSDLVKPDYKTPATPIIISEDRLIELTKSTVKEVLAEMRPGSDVEKGPSQNLPQIASKNPTRWAAIQDIIAAAMTAEEGTLDAVRAALGLLDEELGLEGD